MKRVIFPFTAIVSQEKIKKVLILNAINPSIGGVLIKGDRGTGKTTAVRALADLLPEIDVVENSPFNADENSYRSFELHKAQNKESNDDIKVIKVPMKVVELPLGATEDRVVGSLDIEKALKGGIKALEPGILAQANRNILYVDEINLLDDSLVDILLDAAAYGVNTIEREGISITHPSKFILVGTMNPEEGELRGQLSDRIGLEIEVEGIKDIEDKVLIMKRREEFEKDPQTFYNKFKGKQEDLRKKIVEAREFLDKVEISNDLLEIIARITLELGSEGHRSDIAILKTSKSIAAFNNHGVVDGDDLTEAISLVLGEDKFLAQRIQKIKKDIEKNKEEDFKENLSDNSKESLQEELQKNQETKQIEDEDENNLNQEKDKKDDKKDNNEGSDAENLDLNLDNGESKENNFDDDSDFKVKDDFDSKLNEYEKLENFNETQDRKFDIKKF